jgi:micrococcal nuclease
MRRATLIALAALTAAPAAAEAGTGPCLPGGDGPRCQFWTGRVVHVHDGDTIEVRSGGRNLRVRITGIQAMEQTVYSSYATRRRGECHAVAATNRLERLVRDGRGVVRLAAQRASSRSGSRWRRSVAVRDGAGWRDVGRVLVAEGHALWLTNPDEWAWNATYAEAAERARDQRLRLWHPDASLRRYEFPSGAEVGADESVTVRVGRGSAHGGVFHWGLGEPAFENPAGDGRHVGDGAYLFDPDGDLRASDIYY